MKHFPSDIERRSSFRPVGAGGFRFRSLLSEPFYDSCFDMDWRVPRWALTRYTRGRTVKAWRRDGTPIPLDRGFDCFCANPRLPGSPIGADYANSGHHTGHMVPAEAMQFDRDALLSSFYTTNACPQRGGLNCGPWRTLESKIFQAAARGLELMVVAGPVVTSSVPARRASGIVVPDLFFKVVACPDSKTVACWIMPNAEHPDADLDAHRATLDNVERLAGLRFPGLAGYRELPRLLCGARDISPSTAAHSIKVENLLNGEWVALEPLKFTMHDTEHPGAEIVMPLGFRFDFGSVPGCCHWLIEGTGTRRDLVYALHDWLYATEYFAWDQAYKQISDPAANRSECDLALLEGCKVVGDNWLTRNTIYSAVRLGGGAVWKQHTAQSVAEARRLLIMA